MNGLIATPLAPLDPDGASVVADGWFPPVALDRVRAVTNLGGGAITTAQLTFAIEGAMVTALRLLASWRTARVLAGAQDLAGVSDQTLNGRPYAAILWERAVAWHTAADLFAANPDISATDHGVTRAADKARSSDEARREANAAIADLLSIDGPAVARCRVEML